MQVNKSLIVVFVVIALGAVWLFKTGRWAAVSAAIKGAAK